VKRLLLSLLLTAMMSIVVMAQSVYVDYDHNLDFSQYHTYAWGQQPNPNQIKNPFLAQEAQNQVNLQLQGKGLQMVQESQTPDLIVVCSGGMKVQTSYNAWGGGGWRWGGGYGTISPEQSYVGTLIVDLYDPKAKQLAWRGEASGTLNESNAEKNRQLVDKAVTKMFQKYPSPSKK